MRPAAASLAVTLEGVSKAFGQVVAVKSIDLVIEAGALVTLLGPSGCGKSTTLRMIAGLETPTAGRVVIGGKDVTRLPPNERDVSMVFQSYALFPHMSVIENVSYGLRPSGLSRAAQRAKAQEGLRLVGLEGYDARYPSELSGGQQQRVAVARALVLEPQVLLFDEPLSNLDAKLRRKMREEIRDLQQRLGLTAVYVTHDQEEALAISDRIVVMHGGAIAQEGTPGELYERPADAFVADFIGSANLIPARIVARDPHSKRATVAVAGATLTVPDRGQEGDAVLLVVRPSAVALAAKSGDGHTLAGRIEKAAYLGSHREYTVSVGDTPILVTQPAAVVFEPGATVYLRLEASQLAVVRHPKAM